jgi:hypothetical protein
MCLSVAVGANRNAVPNAVTLLGPENVVYVQEARIVPGFTASLVLALPSGPAKHRSSDALIALDVRPYGSHLRGPVASEQRVIDAGHIVECIVNYADSVVDKVLDASMFPQRIRDRGSLVVPQPERGARSVRRVILLSSAKFAVRKEGSADAPLVTPDRNQIRKGNQRSKGDLAAFSLDE